MAAMAKGVTDISVRGKIVVGHAAGYMIFRGKEKGPAPGSFFGDMRHFLPHLTILKAFAIIFLSCETFVLFHFKL